MQVLPLDKRVFSTEEAHPIPILSSAAERRLRKTYLSPPEGINLTRGNLFPEVLQWAIYYYRYLLLRAASFSKRRGGDKGHPVGSEELSLANALLPSVQGVKADPGGEGWSGAIEDLPHGIKLSMGLSLEGSGARAKQPDGGQEKYLSVQNYVLLNLLHTPPCQMFCPKVGHGVEEMRMMIMNHSGWCGCVLRAVSVHPGIMLLSLSRDIMLHHAFLAGLWRWLVAPGWGVGGVI
jgi:hypothetical protein